MSSLLKRVASVSATRSNAAITASRESRRIIADYLFVIGIFYSGDECRPSRRDVARPRRARPQWLNEGDTRVIFSPGDARLRQARGTPGNPAHPRRRSVAG